MIKSLKKITGVDWAPHFKEYLKSSDLGFNIGAGYDFGHLGLDVRYNMGLSNVSDDEEDGVVKNNVIQIGLSYAF